MLYLRFIGAYPFAVQCPQCPRPRAAPCMAGTSPRIPIVQPRFLTFQSRLCFLAHIAHQTLLRLCGHMPIEHVSRRSVNWHTSSLMALWSAGPRGPPCTHLAHYLRQRKCKIQLELGLRIHTGCQMVRSDPRMVCSTPSCRLASSKEAMPAIKEAMPAIVG